MSFHPFLLTSRERRQYSSRLQEKSRAMPASPRHPRESDPLRGSIDLRVLKALALEPMHGWGIGLRIGQISNGRLDVNQGSLYPALQRLEHRGWVESDWQSTENNRRARYYSITREGRRQLEAEIADWERTSGAVNRVLRYALQGG